MFVKVTTSGPRRYVQLVESYRDEAGRVKKRTVATLGRLDQLTGELDAVIDGLLKVSGREPVSAKTAASALAAAPAAILASSLSFEAARALGNVWALTELWKELGFSDLRRVFRPTRHTIDVEALIRIMVLNRLCDPDSKLGVLRWLQTVALPDIDVKALTHQQLLRSMDALMDQQAAVDGVVAGLLRPLVDHDLSMAFYDMTTIRAEGLTTMEGDVRKFGMAKEGLIARQFMLGVVQTAEGLPIYHEVFDGNTAETKTLLPILKKVMDRFPNLRRLILVADRGLLSLDNLEALQAIRLRPDIGQDPSKGQALEFIIAVPGRRYHEFADLLQPLQAQCAKATSETTGEVAWNGLRMVVAHDPATALEQHRKRKAVMSELELQAKGWAGKLDDQDQGAKKRGRKLSDSGTKARFYHAVLEAHLGKIIKVDMKAELFSYTIDEETLRLAEMMDGKLLVVTNVQDMTPDKVIERYKSLADIERGFKVLKSELEIGPVYHRLPERIRAHASICFMALILHRVMRMRLRAANAGVTPERALQSLKRIQHHRVSINGAPPLCGVSCMTTEHNEVLKALKVKTPSHSQQLSLL